MAISLRFVWNKLAVNQFGTAGKSFNQGGIFFKFLVEKLPKRSYSACSINVKPSPCSEKNTNAVDYEETMSICNHNTYILDFTQNELHKMKNRRRINVDHLVCIHEKYSNTFPSTFLNSSLLSDFEKQAILLAETTDKDSSSIPTKPQQQKSDNGKPTEEQLKRVFDVLAKTLPNLFVDAMDYSIYNQNIIFENNIKGTKTIGIYNYIKQVAILRTIGHFKFAFVKFDILKITYHPEDSTVKVRWRIRGISGLKAFFYFWRFKLWELKDAIQKEEEIWYDGFSIFHVGGDGLIYKHVADKMQPDTDQEMVKPKIDSNIKFA